MPISAEYEERAGAGVIGVDEAGRGPLAGPVVAAAVHLTPERAAELLATDWQGVNDSKKLTARRREKLAEVIKSTPDCLWAVAAASPQEIDELNILRATHLAMRRAVEAVQARLPRGVTPFVLVDGCPVKGLPCESLNLIKGDARSVLIAAASILAKTTRDHDCDRLDKLYPQYGFAKHKGYPTKAHFDALAKFGPCPEHRRSFGPVANALACMNLPGF